MALRDLEVQTDIAKCLIEGTSRLDPDRGEAISFLRSHIDTGNVMMALASAMGLARNSDPADVDNIAGVAQRIPAVTSFLAEYFAVTCGASVNAIVRRMEDQTDDADRKRRIDTIYQRSAEWRKANCR
jgi:hypothetical protein